MMAALTIILSLAAIALVVWLIESCQGKREPDEVGGECDGTGDYNGSTVYLTSGGDITLSGANEKLIGVGESFAGGGGGSVRIETIGPFTASGTINCVQPTYPLLGDPPPYDLDAELAAFRYDEHEPLSVGEVEPRVGQRIKAYSCGKYMGTATVRRISDSRIITQEILRDLSHCTMAWKPVQDDDQ